MRLVVRFWIVVGAFLLLNLPVPAVLAQGASEGALTAANDGAPPPAQFLPLIMVDASDFGPLPEPAAPVIASEPVTAATVGAPYVYDVDASGMPRPVFTLVTAPEDATIDETSGLISWTPTAAGIFSFAVRAANSEGAASQAFAVQVTLAPLAPEIISEPERIATVGEPYLYDVTAIGVPPPTYFLSQGVEEMSINADSGIVAWTPTVEGEFAVTVEAMNAVGSAVQTFSVLVKPAPIAPRITSEPVVGGTVGDPYRYSVVASGVPSPTFAFLQHPDGMAIEPATGEITWIPTVEGEHEVVVEAVNVAGADWQIFTVLVDPRPVRPEILSAPNGNGTVSEPYNYQIVATGVPSPTYRLLENPDGMTINPADGLISWTPAAVGEYAVTVEAANIAGAAGQSFVVQVEPQPVPPQITSTPPLETAISEVYVYDVTASGVPEPEYFLIQAPPDMSVDQAGGRITWTPDTVGDYTVTVEARNKADIASQTFSIRVDPEPVPPQITSQPVTVGTVGQSYSYSVQATGEPLPTFRLTQAPDGMNIDANSGVITWNSATPDEYSVTVEATNRVGVASQSYTLVIEPQRFAPQITSEPVRTATVGDAYAYDVAATGVPNPTYSLADKPNGMAIDPGSGLITWTPAVGQGGNHAVVVTASNSEGSDTQSYAISVQDDSLSCPSPIRIMPLGDSITKGSGTSPQTGYRQSLYLALTGAGHNVNFVGGESSGASAQPAFDADHEGHSSWEANDIRDNIYGGGRNWLAANPADVVLLHIGTNDVGDGDDNNATVAEIGQILDRIDQFERDRSSSVTVVLAQIINRRDLGTDAALRTSALNDAIADLADARIADGDRLVLVNMEYALNYPGDFADFVHPNSSGYGKMSAVWFNGLQSFLPTCTLDELAGIDVMPMQADVAAGESVQFTSMGFDAAGNTVALIPQWSASEGVIGAGGLFTAGGTPATVTVTASKDAASRDATVTVTEMAHEFPGAFWSTAPPGAVDMEWAKLEEARDYALTGGGAGLITRHGKVIMSWGDTSQLYDLKSTTKSIGVTALGLALKDGLMGLDDVVQNHHPEIGVPPDSNAATGWLDAMTVRQLATQTAGFDKNGGYTGLLFEPGTAWYYSDGGPNWLAEAITLRYGQDLNSLLFNRVFTPLGIDDSELTWRDNVYRNSTINGVARREFGSGISANVDAMARIGYLYLRDGEWDGVQLLDESFTAAVGAADPGVIGLPEIDPDRDFNASDHYGLLWWNNADGSMANVPRDAYWSWGLYESLIIVIPSLGIVTARAGSGWQDGWSADYTVVEPFIEAIALSATDGPAN